MAAKEVLSLDEIVPQALVPQAGDTYEMPRDVNITGDLTVTGTFPVPTNISGNAATVTTNANLTGHVTSSGNATTLNSFTLAQLNTAISDANVLPTTTPIVLGIAAGDATTSITTGAGKAEFQIVNGAFTLVAIYATVSTAPTGSTIIIDVNLNDTSIMTTNKLSIDATEQTSDTAATQPALTTTALTENGVITVDFDQVGSTEGGVQPIIYLVGYWT